MKCFIKDQNDYPDSTLVMCEAGGFQFAKLYLNDVNKELMLSDAFKEASRAYSIRVDVGDV